MKTKNEIAESIWKQAKKNFWFQVISGLVLPLVLFFFPTMVHSNLTVVEMLLCCAGLSVMFIVYGIMQLTTYRKKKMINAYNNIVAGANNTEFIYMGYSREYFHPELYTLPEELKPIIINTKAYSMYDEAMNSLIGCNIFGPIIFAVAGIGGLSFGYPTLWLHVNPYIAVILLGTYLYYTSRMDKQYDKMWAESFVFANVRVDLKKHFPELFSQWNDEYTIKNVGFVMPAGTDGKSFAEKIKENYIADIKKREQEKAKKAVDENVVQPA
ncbi:MAG: hypothetical protein WCG25_01300 [bacterium]